MKDLEERYQDIRRRILLIRPDAQLIAVSKKQPLEKIKTLYQLGHRDFGENYVQEFLEKRTALEASGCEGIRWHFIGRLQTNKVRQLMNQVESIHSIDSLKLAREVSKRGMAVQIRTPVYLQVNISNEPSKSGFTETALEDHLSSIVAQPALQIEGLMCIPAPDSQREEVYSQMSELSERTKAHHRGKLSMGMSDDFELALRLGATSVRVGSALFGARA